MNTITETTEIERKKLAFQIIENNVRTLEDGYRSLKWYSPCKIDYNSDVDVEAQIIKYYKDKVKHSKKVLEIVKKYLPTDYCIINQLIGRLEYCKTQIKNARKYS